ncbi:MAG: reverse transcriptase domain-containing protein [Saprospiraceae bacterium]
MLLQLVCAVAVLARRLASEYVDPQGLEALLANRGIAIDKCPGLRPVGVGEIMRRIVGKAIMIVTGPEIQSAVGALQLCAGHPTGVEAAIHSMREFLSHEDNDGILLIDADNAFNRVNRAVALWNVQFICPAAKYVLINVYRIPTRIFMVGDSCSFELLSQEGTTQGCPLAMAMYALALVPLLHELHPLCKQVWYADDATGCDSFERMRQWFDALQSKGPKYGYFPKPSKCILVVKPERFSKGQEIFKGTGVSLQTDGTKDTGVEINTTGTRHLGAAVGTSDFKTGYVNKKIDSWISALKKLSMVANSQPHAAFTAFTQCMQGQWAFICRAMPDVSPLFLRLEEAIRMIFLPALLRRQVNDLEREVLSMPARMGGLGIYKPQVLCVSAHENSNKLSAPLVKLILRQELDLDPEEIASEVKHLRMRIDEDTEKLQKLKLESLLSEAPHELKSAMKMTIEKGASSWVTATPLYDHGTILHKGDFVDSIYMRYGWLLPDLPVKCPCNAAYSLQHALDCKLGGFRTIQHNEVRDVIAQVMRDAGHVVETEPPLQKLTGEGFDYKSANREDEARSDIKVTGFYREQRNAFFDVKVVSPFAKSYSQLTQASLMKTAEKSKMREYKQRIHEIEHADFNPLVFTTMGAMAPQCQAVVKKLAEKLSFKQGSNLSVVTGWLRVRLSFALLRTSLQCIRGSRRKKFSHTDTNVDLAVSQARIPY